MAQEILMIDDDDDDIYMYQKLFNSIAPSLKFSSVSNLEELLTEFPDSTAPEHLPNVILLDLNIPKFNGMDIANTLKQHKWLKHIPVLVLTTSSSPLDMKDCKKIGIQSYFVKPQNYDDCKNLVHSIYQYWFELNRFNI